MTTPRSPVVGRDGDVTVVTLGAEYENLDESSVREVRDVILEVADSAEPPLVLLDLAATTFFGSSFLEALFRAHNHIRERGGRFAICSLQEYCEEVVEVTHLDRLIEIFPNVPIAVASLQKPRD